MLYHIQSNLISLPPHDAEDGRTVVVHGPVASDLVGPLPGRILGIRVRHPFLSRILVHHIGFDHVVRQGRPIQPGLDLGLDLRPMAQVQEMAAATTEFAIQLGRRHPLGETTEDQDDLRGPPLRRRVRR